VNQLKVFLLAACLSTNVMAMGAKLPKCQTPVPSSMICGDVTDFCGPHFGACVPGGVCNYVPEPGAIAPQDGSACIAISYPNGAIKKELEKAMEDNPPACVHGEMNSSQVLVVDSVCGP